MKRRTFVTLLTNIFIGYIFGCIFTKILEFALIQMITIGFLIIFLVSILFPVNKSK